MLPRQVVAALLAMLSQLGQPSVWIGFGILFAGYDLSMHLAPVIVGQISGLTEFGLGNAGLLIVSLVRMPIELCIELVVVLIIARSAVAADAASPPWWGAMVGYFVVPRLVVAALAGGIGTVIAARQPFGMTADDLSHWQLEIDLVCGLLLILPTSLALARAAGDRDTDWQRLVIAARPPALAWGFAAIAVALGLALMVTQLRAVVGAVALSAWGYAAAAFAVNALRLALVTIVWLAFCAALVLHSGHPQAGPGEAFE